MASNRRDRSQLTLTADINLTPMIDLVFLLLIVFMITTPLLENSIDVNPPAKNADPLPDQNFKIINIDKNGKIIFDDRPYDYQELQKKLGELRMMNSQCQLLLRADGKNSYEKVIEVLALASNAGFQNVKLITQEE